MDVIEEKHRRIFAQFKSESGETLGVPIELTLNVTVEKLQLICNALLQTEEKIPYIFFIDDTEIVNTLENALLGKKIEIENVLEIIYVPQAVFKVRAVTRCTSSIPGHAEAVISAAFSPDGRYLASGSGDTTVRFWDINTETPQYTCNGHKNWVLCISWSPDGHKLASGCKSGQIFIWDPNTGKQLGRTLTGHTQWITWISWEPLHRNSECRRLATSSKDSTIRIWDTFFGHTLFTLSGHTKSVTCVKWGGTGLIYTSSQDTTIKVWRDNDGVLCRTLKGHGHWVNILALNTDYVLRTGTFDPSKAHSLYNNNFTNDELATKAAERYNIAKGNEPEKLVSGSDDFTLFLWNPEIDKKPIFRMTGHQQLVNDIKFSPDTRLIASASFDKSVKLWDGKTGKYLAAFRGHVQAVYQISWSADSRLLVSGSADSTLKVWEIKTKKLLMDLPGHADEVYAVDWNPNGLHVVSGGKDKVIKIWRR